MDELLSYLKVRRNLVNLLVLLIIVLGIPVAINLLQQAQVFRSKADIVPIRLVENECIKMRNGKAVAICPEVKLELTSPIGGPGEISVASPVPTPSARASQNPSPVPTPSPSPVPTPSPSPVASPSPSAAASPPPRLSLADCSRLNAMALSAALKAELLYYGYCGGFRPAQFNCSGINTLALPADLKFSLFRSCEHRRVAGD